MNRQDETRSLADLPGPWNLPHEDAEFFIRGVILSAERSMHGEGSADPSQSEEKPARERPDSPDSHLARFDIRDNVDIGKRMGHLDYVDSFDEYEGRWHDEESKEYDRGLSSEKIAERREFIACAHSALLSGDPDEVLGSLVAFLDSFDQPPQFVGIESVENWAGVLAAPSAVVSEDDRDSHDTGKLVVQAVHDLCVRLCSLIAADARLLWHIEWREMERVIATALAGIGFDVELTPPAKDGGKDVVARCWIRGFEHIYYIEIKHWRSGKRVGDKIIYDFVEVNATDRTDGALLLSSSGFSPSVYSQLSEVERRNVRIGADQKIVSLCQHFVRRGSGIWTSSATLPHILFERTIRPVES